MAMTRIPLRTCSHRDSLFLNVSREIAIMIRGIARVQLPDFFRIKRYMVTKKSPMKTCSSGSS